MSATRSRDASEDARQGGGLRWRIVRPLFELLYRSRTLYWLASTIPFAGQWRVWQRLVLSRLTGHDVLEVGCGTGALLADMIAAGYVCVGVDRSPQMVAAARRELRRRRVVADAESTVRRASAQHLPFEGASFDSVVSTFPTTYIADPVALGEMSRVLRPDGRIVVVLGAALLPTRAALRPFVWFQDLVYGRPATHRSGATEQVTAAPAESGLVHACAGVGLSVRAERVRGPFWEAYLILGEKTDIPPPTKLIQ